MISRRRKVLLTAPLFFGAAVGLAYASTAAVSPVTERDFLGGSIICGAAVLLIVVACMRRSEPGTLEAAKDPNGIVHLAMRTVETRLAAIGLVLLAAGAGFLAFDGGSDIRPHVAGWLVMVCGVIAALKAFMSTRPGYLRLAPEGLDFSPFGVGPIPWKDIRAARSMWAFGRVQMVALDLDNEEVYQARRHGLRWRFAERLLLSSSFTLVPPSFEMTCDMLAKAIEIRIAAFGRGSQPA